MVDKTALAFGLTIGIPIIIVGLLSVAELSQRDTVDNTDNVVWTDPIWEDNQHPDPENLASEGWTIENGIEWINQNETLTVILRET